MNRGENKTIMNRGEASDSIPNDLIIEIFSRLPAESIARFSCLSKLWGSMFHRPYFTELFLTRSLARPRLLYAFKRHNGWSFYSSPQNPYEKSSSVVHMKSPRDPSAISCGYASGLTYFSGAPMICNPNTGRYRILPRVRNSYSFLGFDPIDKQFKVLSMAYLYPTCDDDCHKVLTLETGIVRWRKIQCPVVHEAWSSDNGICINGVLYILAEGDGYERLMIVCFDVRSEKFDVIEDGECFLNSCVELVNYNGKLGVIHDCNHYNPDELRMWVLENAEKREWSKHVYNLPENVAGKFSVAGMTATGEIVLSMKDASKPFLYFNPERNTLQSVEIQGFGDEAFKSYKVYTFVGHVEDLNLNDAKILNSSIVSSPSVENKRSIDIISERPKDSKYDDGMSREKKHREGNERNIREEEDRIRRSEDMRDREKRVESGRDRDRDMRYDDGMSREKKHRERNGRDSWEDEARKRRRCREEIRDREKRVESGRDRDRDRDMRYDDGMCREKKHREGNGRNSGEDEERRRRRRSKDMRDRERHVESRSDRDDHWNGKGRRRQRDNERWDR